MVKKKTNNPFKLWGSYVGIILFFTIADIIIFERFNIFNGSSDGNIISLYFNNLINSPLGAGLGMTIFLVGGGFILGYGIHLLIRKLRK
jgi:hypothetical protein